MHKLRNWLMLSRSDVARN